jgi:hypothetical protein
MWKRLVSTYSPVAPSNGHTELTRILWGPNLAARPFVAYIHSIRLGIMALTRGNGEFTFQTAPLVALYHTNPGRGLVAPTEAILTITPPFPCSISKGINAAVAK